MKIEIPTTLSKESNTQFRTIYRKNFGIDLSIQHANEEANKVLTFMAIVIENINNSYGN